MVNRSAMLAEKEAAILAAILKYVPGKLTATWQKICSKLEES
jgi:hypothetical protein